MKEQICSYSMGLRLSSAVTIEMLQPLFVCVCVCALAMHFVEGRTFIHVYYVSRLSVWMCLTAAF